MYKTRLYFVLVVLFLQWQFLFAQFEDGKLYLLEKDEANKPKILCLYQNIQGFILCGTTKGLYRFDGFDFSLYDQGNIKAGVTAISETQNKKIWIGFSNGNIGELVNNKIRLLKFEEGFPSVAIKSIIQDEHGTIWIGTAGEGIYYIMNKKLYNINEDDGLSDNYIYKLLSLPNSGVVAATDRGLNVCNLRNGKKTILTFTSRNGLPDNIVRSIYAADNNLWLGMQDAGIKAYKYNLTPASNLTNKWIYGQVNDIVTSGTKVYIATEDSALMVYCYRDNMLYNKQYSDRTISKVNCLLKDREGNVWAAGGNELLLTGKTGVEEIFNLTKTEAEEIHCIHYTSDFALWFNTSGGITRLHKVNGGWKKEKFLLPALANAAITSLYEDVNDNLWVGSLGKGIVVFNHEKKVQRVIQDHHLINSNIISITGKQNAIWISSLEGVVRATINGNIISYTDYTDTASIGNKYVYHIFIDSKDRVWFATDGEGISVLKNGKFTHLKNTPGYIGNVVYKIVEDADGNIWYATYDRGIVKYDGKTFKSYTTEQGLSDAAISSLLTAGKNISVIYKNSIDIINPSTAKISYLDKAQPLLNINTDLNACTNDNAGNIYFLSNSSIYSYKIPGTIEQPTVSIDKVKLFLEDIQGNKSNTFKYNENNLSFFYAGIYYSQPEKISYQYKLEGYDKQWINTKDRFKNFPNLPPGNYTFRVRVSLNKNFSNAKEADFSFTINKPLWLQPWFIVSSLVLLMALFYSIIKLREKNLQHLSRLEKEKIQSQLETLRNQINPHFLFNSFNTLISEIETNPDRAVTYVEYLSDFYRSIVVHRDKDLITLAEEFHIVKDYTFLQQKRYCSGLSININVDAATAVKYSVVPLGLQLLIENAIKHNVTTKETPLKIDVSISDAEYLVVHNTINPKLYPEKSSGMGLQNIQKRYALLCKKPVIIEQTTANFIVKLPLILNAHD